MNIYITVEDETKVVDCIILDLPEGWKGLFNAVDTLRQREAEVNKKIRDLVDFGRHKYLVYCHNKTHDALLQVVTVIKQLEALGYQVSIGPSDAFSASRRSDAV